MPDRNDDATNDDAADGAEDAATNDDADGAEDAATRDESAADAADADESAAVEDGRYLYCVVDVDDEPDVETGSRIDETGVADEDPYLVVSGDVAAVVHPATSAYHSTNETTVKRWLLQHQGIVDAADERFGTPLPVRFDTILEGDDESVTEWLDSQRAALRSSLDRFAGHSEYRIELTCDSDEFAANATADDDRIEELQADPEEEGEGTAFLRSKQVEQRERTVVAERWEETLSTLREVLESNAQAVEDIDRSVATLAGGGDDDRADFETTYAVLADEEAAATIGDRLDDVAGKPGVGVRYTGPWPPYTFAPSLGPDA